MSGTCPRSDIRQAVSNDPEELNDTGAPGPKVAKKNPKIISIHGVTLSAPFSVCHLPLFTAAVGHFYGKVAAARFTGTAICVQ